MGVNEVFNRLLSFGIVLAAGCILVEKVVDAQDDDYGIIYGAIVDAVEEAREEYAPIIRILARLTPRPPIKDQFAVPSYTEGSFLLSARDLHNENVDPGGGSPDPYVIVSRSKPKKSNSNSTEWVTILTTKSQADTSDPDWTEELNVKLKPGQKYKFDIYDYDLVNADDFIAQAVIRSEELMKLRTGSITKNCRPKGSGQLIIFKSEGFKKQIFL